MWMMPLHLHVNQISDYDYDDDEGKHTIFFPATEIRFKMHNIIFYSDNLKKILHKCKFHQ